LDLFRLCGGVILDAFRRFNFDDGWAIASHIALSVLLAMFPFLIVVTALAGIFGSANLADEVAHLIVAAWPHEVADPIAAEIHRVLTSAHGSVLTIGAVAAVYFSSSGVESLRIGLNRAYGLTEQRDWWLLRLESIGYVLVSAVALLVLAFVVVLEPRVLALAIKYVPLLQPVADHYNTIRFGAGGAVLAIALGVVHLWLPAGRRRLFDIVPGIAATLLLWLAVGFAFGRYLADFAQAYERYYAGLASVVAALVFLYYSAWIFIYGAELNAALMRARSVARRRGRR
jgi:membrane protein